MCRIAARLVYPAIALWATIMFLTLVSYGQSQPGLPVPGVHSSEAGDCPKCQQGEWSVSHEEMVANGDYIYVDGIPPCDGDIPSKTTQMARAFAEYELPGSNEAAGPLIDAVTGQAVEIAKQYGTNNEQLGGTIRQYLSTYTGQYANCRPICVVFPIGSRFVAASMMAGDGDRGVSKCERDGNGDIVCGVGWSSWDEPEPFSAGNKTGVCATFRNWSHDRQRAASLTVFFVPPPGTKVKKLTELR